jgi:hypothetical protein
VEAVAKACGQFVDLVRAINLDGLSGGIEDDLTMSAAAQVSFELGARLSGHRTVDQIVKEGEKLFTGHFSLPPINSGFVSLALALLALALLEALEALLLWK